jgi:hypothetical protein
MLSTQTERNGCLVQGTVGDPVAAAAAPTATMCGFRVSRGSGLWGGWTCAAVTAATAASTESATGASALLQALPWHCVCQPTTSVGAHRLVLLTRGLQLMALS